MKNKVSRVFQHFDMFGRNIRLTYKGKESYQTVVGGISTIVILTITFLYGGKLFLKLLEKSDITANRSYTIQDLSNLENSAYFSENSPSVAIQFSKIGNTSMDDFISINASHIDRYLGNGVGIVDETHLEIKKCTEDLFPGYSEFEALSGSTFR